MPINLRGNSVPDGSITNAKLADNSVSASKIQTDAVIDTKIAANAVTNTKIATDAVTDTKIASNAVTTPKIANDAITTAKVEAQLAVEHFFGSEVELSHMGTTETIIAEFNFQKSSNPNEDWKTIGWSGMKRSTNAGNTADFNLYIDGVLELTTSSTSVTYEAFDDDSVDISSLIAGSHLVEIKFVNSSPTESAYLSRVDVYLGKK